MNNRTLVRRLIALAWNYRRGCIKVLSLQLVLLALGLAGLGLTGVGIDFIRSCVDPSIHPPHWPYDWQPPPAWSAMKTLWIVGGVIFALAIVRAVLNYLYSINAAILVERQIMVRLRSQVYDKLQRLSFRFFDENASGSIINRVTTDSRAVATFINNVLLQGIIMLLSLLVYLAYMLTINVWLTMACLASTPLMWAMASTFSRKIRPAYLHNRELIDAMILTLSESVQGVHVIKGFARERHTIQKFHDANDAVSDQQTSIFQRVSLFSPAVGFLSQVNLVVLLGYGGYLVIQRQLPLGTGLVVFAGLLQQFSGQVAALAEVTSTVQESLAGSQRVFEILDTTVEIDTRADAVRLARAAGAVRFDHVWFEFKPGEITLEDINLDVAAGQMIAVLGPTGAGKSTLMSLLPRFYDPTRGAVFLDGIDLRQINLDDLRRNIGMVFQESFLFSNTIAVNIAFGSPDASREQIQRAATIAGAHEFIIKLPRGYDSLLTEGGATLSGGQRQRLALARALLLEPSILLLDDPTASIDPETEQEIMAAMTNAMQGRTTFIVAHRLSTLRRADLVIVMEKGRIVQRGTHQQLLATPGHYQRLVHLQIVDDRSDAIANHERV